jgi:hypothetical protein
MPFPVSRLAPGTLHRSYIMTLCANHHRQLHFGKEVDVDLEPDYFVVQVGSRTYLKVSWNPTAPEHGRLRPRRLGGHAS